jgi:hypothetical protein
MAREVRSPGTIMTIMTIITGDFTIPFADFRGTSTV